MTSSKIINGDSLEVLKDLEENSIDAIVTDPPYGLSFMGKKWDYDVPSVDIWKECLRVLKPGGHLLAFAGTRTQHRMAVNIEDAGFEIRDMIAWIYGSGFPKSHNIGKAVDKLQGNDGKWIKHPKYANRNGSGVDCLYRQVSGRSGERHVYKGTSEWEGWGTALKPALEPITVARKPLGEKTVAQNVLKYGTGGINIDESRVGQGREKTQKQGVSNNLTQVAGRDKNNLKEYPQDLGRFPANLIHDGSEEVVEKFPNESSRFFYCAKASKKDRNEGLEGFEEKIQNNETNQSRTFNDRCATCGEKFTGDVGYRCECPPGLKITDKSVYKQKNNHPTVKPTKLMQYLVRLVTRKGGTCLDPFMGSGSTGKACKLEGMDFIGIELDPEYCKIAEARIHAVSSNTRESS